MKCMKCGFEVSEAGAVSCPRCGIVFAKAQRVREEEADSRRRLAAEREMAAAIEKEMESAEEIRDRFAADPEYARDEEGYPMARWLADTFAFLAAFTAITEIMGLVWFYDWGRVIFSSREMILFVVCWVVASISSVAVLLAISVGLRMGRDVANHTRAMREYLRRGAGK